MANSQGPATKRCRRARAAGFSLLGVLIAGALLALVGTAIVGLAFHTGRVAHLTAQRLVAVALAREGVELVRAIRDHNFLEANLGETEEFWWRGGTAETIDIRNGTDWRIDTRSLVLLRPDEAPDILYRSGTANMTYTHDSTGLETPFRRTVEIRTPPDNSQDFGTASKYTPAKELDDPPQPVWVIVRVAWDTRDGSAREVKVGEELYPWMRGR